MLTATPRTQAAKGDGRFGEIIVVFAILALRCPYMRKFVREGEGTDCVL